MGQQMWLCIRILEDYPSNKNGRLRKEIQAENKQLNQRTQSSASRPMTHDKGAGRFPVLNHSHHSANPYSCTTRSGFLCMHTPPPPPPPPTHTHVVSTGRKTPPFQSRPRKKKVFSYLVLGSCGHFFFFFFFFFSFFLQLINWRSGFFFN